jgi:ubiquinone/menaquinone biosynthesis C-methylase UbiE
LQAQNYANGNLLEVGCGYGKGIEIFDGLITSYTGIDKNEKLLNQLKINYPQHKFICSAVPPFNGIEDNSMDNVVTLQVIEHILNDHLFVQEIYRVLKPRGQAIITTPNILLSLTRNPWHVREYKPEEIFFLLKKYFNDVKILGVMGGEKVMDYQNKNKTSIAKFKRLDIFNLENRLPKKILQIPYDILNRINRNKLNLSNDDLVAGINQSDFYLSDDFQNCLDYFCIVTK